MYNDDRLKLELCDKPYLPDELYDVLLRENGLYPGEEYTPQDRRKLLCTVLSVLQIMANDIDLYRKVETEFATVSEATNGLNKRIAALKSEIATLDKQTAESNSCITYLFCGGRR